MSERTPLPTLPPGGLESQPPAPRMLEPEILRGHIPAGHIPKPLVIADYVG